MQPFCCWRGVASALGYTLTYLLGSLECRVCQVTDIGLVVKKKLTAFNGDSICEMDIDYWGPTLQELPMFQGFEEVKKVVEARLQMWADPIKVGQDWIAEGGARAKRSGGMGGVEECEVGSEQGFGGVERGRGSES